MDLNSNKLRIKNQLKSYPVFKKKYRKFKFILINLFPLVATIIVHLVKKTKRNQ